MSERANPGPPHALSVDEHRSLFSRLGERLVNLRGQPVVHRIGTHGNMGEVHAQLPRRRLLRLRREFGFSLVGQAKAETTVLTPLFARDAKSSLSGWPPNARFSARSK